MPFCLFGTIAIMEVIIHPQMDLPHSAQQQRHAKLCNVIMATNRSRVHNGDSVSGNVPGSMPAKPDSKIDGKLLPNTFRGSAQRGCEHKISVLSGLFD